MSKVYPPISRSTEIPIATYKFGVATNSSFQTSKFTKTMTGSTTPGFPAKMQENGMTSIRTSEDFYPGWIKSYSPAGSIAFKDLIQSVDPLYKAPLLAAPPDLVRSVEYRALLRMYDDIPTVTANLALLYAERRKTMEGIAVALGGIVKCMRDVRKGKVPELFMNASELRGRKKFTGAWLNYTYGIKPFVSDLYAITHSDPLNQVIWLKGRATDSREFSQDYSSYGYMTGGKYKATYKFGLSLNSPLTATLAGAGLTNSALIAWELTPFSFMADWALPIGPYLEMLSSTQGYTKHSGSVTKVWKYQGDGWSNRSNAGHHVEHLRIVRTTSGFPSAPLPKFKNPYSPAHALNFLSIIHQFCKEKR